MAKENAKAVMPIITVDSVADVQDFYMEKLGFGRVTGVVGEDGKFNMATLALGGARLMFARPRAKVDGAQPSAGKRPVEIYLEVADVAAYCAQLKERSVKISEPLTLQWWGDKTFKVVDPYGYEIWFYQKIGEPKPPQGVNFVGDLGPAGSA
jgi:uncharacterized glyoxalase superfamily protein PhnB